MDLTFRKFEVMPAVAVLLLAWAARDPLPARSRMPSQPSGSLLGGDSVQMVGAGDIASCHSTGDEATARLLDRFPEAIVFTLGDNAYPNGSHRNFARCYAPAWGRHRARTRPALGNHDHRTPWAAPYFAYFGANAGPSGRGYYAYDAGSWRVIVLDSRNHMQYGSPQERWLRGVLARSPRRCILSYWHLPRFTSGRSRGSKTSRAVWEALYEARVTLVLNGHDHHYERFRRLDARGQPDPVRGIRQFIVGTGGAGLDSVRRVADHSELRVDSTYGVLHLTLYPDSYTWRFISVKDVVVDSGSEQCN